MTVAANPNKMINVEDDAKKSKSSSVVSPKSKVKSAGTIKNRIPSRAIELSSSSYSSGPEDKSQVERSTNLNAETMDSTGIRKKRASGVIEHNDNNNSNHDDVDKEEEEDYYQLKEGVSLGVKDAKLTSLSHLHYLPIIFAVVPPVLSVFHGRPEHWTDLLILLTIGFYLYHVIKTPWEIYYSSRTRRIQGVDKIREQETTPAEVQLKRQKARTELHMFEIIALLGTLISPIIGAQLLWYLGSALHEPEKYINKFNVKLFMLAAGVKPWGHFLRLLRKRTLFLQEEVHYPSTYLQTLEKRLANLENRLNLLRSEVAYKSEISEMRKLVDTPIGELNEAVRRNSTKEHRRRHHVEEKFVDVDAKIDQLLWDTSKNAQMIETLRHEKEREKSGLIMNGIRFIGGAVRAPRYSDMRSNYRPNEIEMVTSRSQLRNSGPASEPDDGSLNSSVQYGAQFPPIDVQQAYVKWYERGPLYCIFLPFYLSSALLRWSKTLLHNMEMEAQWVFDYFVALSQSGTDNK